MNPNNATRDTKCPVCSKLFCGQQGLLTHWTACHTHIAAVPEDYKCPKAYYETLDNPNYAPTMLTPREGGITVTPAQVTASTGRPSTWPPQP